MPSLWPTTTTTQWLSHGPSIWPGLIVGWNSATWEISEALIPHLRTVMDGPGAWDRDQTIGRAIEIRDGVIRNPRILSFQRRSAEFPHTPT